ncbi:MAG: hypothetical protein HY088_10470, partial [Ignavibacteriales bacterium]|nr:hypothetical protein [Ignavibacteriales bacterium]
MKQHIRGVLIALLLLQTSFAQEAAQFDFREGSNQSAAAYPISGCRLLWQEEAKIAQYVKEHPEVIEASRLMKKTLWNFNVGDTHAWWATDLSKLPQSEYLVPSTCKAVGPNSYIFVEDSLWNNGRVNQAGVDSILTAFEMRIPASATKGIYQMDTETFGNPPNVDGDPKIVILILDIKDGWSGSGGYTAGYFYSLNQFPEGTFSGRHSNYTEIYYIDGNPGNLTTSSGVTNAASTTAHEFQHMIHFNYDRNEVTFINEACSEVASLVCGYSYSGQNLYTDNTNVSLFPWNSTLADYSRAARWALYLWNQFPNGYLKKLVADAGTGITGINNALALYTPTTLRQFDDIFQDWLVANNLNDASFDARYGYTFAGSLTKATGTKYLDPSANVSNATVAALGASYITFSGGSNLSITFSATSPIISVKAIKIGASSKQVVNVPLEVAFSEPGFGTTYSTITFVVSNSSQSLDASYSFQSSGSSGSAVELKWDETEPLGRLSLAPLDTVCVTFDAIAGAKLDSIRVALRRAGTMSGGVWTYTGVSRPSPLGARLAFPLTVSTSTTFSTPFPVPYPNWKTIDLRSFNIKTDLPFVIGFWQSSDTSKDAYVTVTKTAGQDPYHSFTYLHSPSSGSPNWYYITANPTEIYLYNIRGYVSSAVT